MKSVITPLIITVIEEFNKPRASPDELSYAF